MKTTLDKIRYNQTATIDSISNNENSKQQLLNLGITKGCTITPMLISPFGKTTAYKINGTVIAMRNNNAENINVST